MRVNHPIIIRFSARNHPIQRQPRTRIGRIQTSHSALTRMFKFSGVCSNEGFVGALRRQWGWTHFKVLMAIEEEARETDRPLKEILERVEV